MLIFCSCEGNPELWTEWSDGVCDEDDIHLKQMFIEFVWVRILLGVGSK